MADKCRSADDYNKAKRQIKNEKKKKRSNRTMEISFGLYVKWSDTKWFSCTSFVFVLRVRDVNNVKLHTVPLLV